MITTCSLEGCGKNLKLANPTYKDPDGKEYCCREHCQQGFAGKKSKSKSKEAQPESKQEAEVPHELADDFGDAGVIRRFCDNPACRKPVTLCWKGRNGEYCSNECLKITEKDKKTMTTPEDTNDSPVTAGAPAAPKKGKKAVAKKATGKAAKAAGKAPKAEGAGRRADRKITVIAASKAPADAKGLLAEGIKLCLKSKTEGDLFTKLQEKTGSPYSLRKKVIDTLVDAGAIKVA